MQPQQPYPQTPQQPYPTPPQPPTQSQFPLAPQPYPGAYPQQHQAPPTAPYPYPTPPQPPYPVPQPQQPPYGQPPTPAPMAGNLDDFYNQPSTGGGKSLSFEAVGTTYTGIVTRPIGDGDIEQQTNPQNGQPSFFKDGRPKYVMKVPLQMQPLPPSYPDGLAQWYVRGPARDELVRAMAEAGAPEGPPEPGAIITVTMTGTRSSGPGMSPTKLFQVVYRRPQGAQPTAPAATPPVAQIAPPPPAPTPESYHAAAPPIYATNDAATNGNGYAPVVSTASGQPVTHQQSVPPPPPTAPTPEMSPEQQALIAQLTGGAAPQPTH